MRRSLVALSLALAASEAASEGATPVDPLRHVLELVSSGTVTLPTSAGLSGFAVSDTGEIFAADPAQQKILRIRGGRVVAWIGNAPGRNLFRLPWHLRWTSKGLWVVDRDPERPALVLLDPDSGAIRRHLPIPATPGVAEFPDGNLVTGFRHLLDEGNQDMVHVYSPGGVHLRSFFPLDRRDDDASPFAAAAANELAFDVTQDGNLVALQSFEEKVRAFTPEGRESFSISARCPRSASPDFSAPPPKYRWDERSWSRWRNSWTRLVSVRAVGDLFVTHTVREDGVPGWIDVFDQRGTRILGCVEVGMFPAASEGQQILFVRREPVDTGTRFSYRLYRALAATRRVNSADLLSAAVVATNGDPQTVAALSQDRAALLVLLDPAACSACMAENAAWRTFQEACPSLHVFGVVEGIESGEEFQEFVSFLDPGIPLYWDPAGTLRETLGRDPQASLPYKVLLGADGTLFGSWPATAAPDEQRDMREEIARRLCCSGPSQTQGSRNPPAAPK